MRLDRIKLSIPHTKTSIADKRKSNATPQAQVAAPLPKICSSNARACDDDAQVGVVGCGVDMTWILTVQLGRITNYITPESKIKEPRHLEVFERHSSPNLKRQPWPKLLFWPSGSITCMNLT